MCFMMTKRTVLNVNLQFERLLQRRRMGLDFPRRPFDGDTTSPESEVGTEVLSIARWTAVSTKNY